MAKNFTKAGASIAAVAKKSKELANTPVMRMIDTSMLVDHPANEETLETTDIEASIAELGFTDPIEVTGYGMPDGQYMIVSGRRRRAAGEKCGMKVFPCIIKDFATESDVENYILYANASRDSVKDPLLLAKRFKATIKYLESVGFKGSKREEAARRMGLSIQQADRYNQFLNVLPQVWGLVQSGTVGMSSILSLASMEEKQQEEIYMLLIAATEQGIALTRDVCAEIINRYKKDKKGERNIVDELTEPTIPAPEAEAAEETDPSIDATEEEVKSMTATPEAAVEVIDELIKPMITVPEVAEETGSPIDATGEGSKPTIATPPETAVKTRPPGGATANEEPHGRPSAASATQSSDVEIETAVETIVKNLIETIDLLETIKDYDDAKIIADVVHNITRRQRIRI